MSENPVLIGAAQWDVKLGDPERNFMFLDRFAREAAAAGVKLLVLPELWPVSFDVKNPKALEMTRKVLDRSADLSRELKITLIGSVLEGGAAKPYNQSCLLENGKLTGFYRKVHLFSPTGEPKAFTRGDEDPPVFETEIGRVGLIICYDLRFPETVRKLYAQEVDIITVPAQWATPRVEHWKALLIARAIENQCYVIGANRCGSETQNERETHFPGCSLVVNAWGEVLAQAGREPGWVAGNFTQAHLQKIRKEVPARRDSRS